MLLDIYLLGSLISLFMTILVIIFGNYEDITDTYDTDIWVVGLIISISIMVAISWLGVLITLVDLYGIIKKGE